MKDKLIKWLGGYTRAEIDRVIYMFEREIRETVEKHEMQNAWEQIKQERKLGRLN